MAIRRYIATADTTITNAYKSNLTTRGDDANMGRSDVLEIFAIYAQADATSTEEARILVKFSDETVTKLAELRDAHTDFKAYLKIFNAPHSMTLPTDFILDVATLTTDWEEGQGLDMEEYSDIGLVVGDPLTAATADLIFDMVSHQFNSITLISTDGTSRTYTASTSNDYPNNIFNGQAFDAHLQLKAAIEHAAGHDGKIIVTVSGDDLTFTQAVKGVAGNTTITSTLAQTTADASFTGGYTVTSGTGATWNAASSQINWPTPGGAFDSVNKKTTTIFDEGYEELEIDITSFIATWEANNYGLIIKLAEAHINSNTSFYTKRFFARGTEYFYERPIIEARWDGSEADDRANFYVKSDLRSDADNTNTIYLKNYVDGALENIPDPLGVTSNGIIADNTGNEQLQVKFYAAMDKNLLLNSTVTLNNDVEGVYKADVILETNVSNPYVCWQACDEVNYTGGTAIEDGCGDSGDGKLFTYHEEYIKSKRRTTGSERPTYVTAIQNLKNSYSNNEFARFRLFTRLKDWSPTIYTIATKELRPEIVEKAYYRIVRVVDDFVVIDYGTEAPEHTKLSYDKDGSYFDLDMSLFEQGWAYRIEFMYDINGELRQQPETFKFRVE